MRSSTQKARRKVCARLLMVAALMCAVVSMALSDSAISAESSAQSMMAITVANNSSREIRHMYLSPVDRKEWGPDQMDGSVLKAGETFTITDVSCSGNEIKVVAEDKEGCFLYGVVSCAQPNAAWTINNDTSVDCGS
jgi:hypothetical protein